MHENIETGLLILAAAMTTAIMARQINLPYTIGLVIVGVIISISEGFFHPQLTHDLIYFFLLPPLLFEASLFIPYHELKRDALPISVLAVVGTIVSAAFIASSMIFLIGWPTGPALLFGSLIAATDPVAIIAMFKDNKITGRTSLLVEAESLANDGVASILFSCSLIFSHSMSDIDASMILQDFFRTVFIALIIGAVFGFLSIIITRRTSDHLIETVITIIAAYGSFIVAEELRASGVLATVMAGLIIGNIGVLGGASKSLSPRGRELVVSFWEVGAFIVNSVIFLLIGINVADIPIEKYGPTIIISTIAICMIGRALAVYPLGALFRNMTSKISISEQHVLWWGGLRGALGLALALSLPNDMPMRDEIVVFTFAVAVSSIVIQGLSMPFLLRRLGFLI